MDKIIRVLIVDDSAYVRKVIKQMLSRNPFIEVVDTARDGEEALEKIESLNPDVVTLDLIMPQMDGVEFLQKQMARRPIPVVVVSIANEGGELVLAALDAGAVDFVQKPTALATEKIFEISEELIEKVKAAACVPLSHLPTIAGLEKSSNAAIKAEETEVILDLEKPLYLPNIKLVAIGISTGGPQALALLIPQLPANFPVPIVVVLHMPVGYTKMYAQRLDQLSALQVIEVQEGDRIEPGMVAIAPAGRHLKFYAYSNGSVTAHLEARPFDTLHRPSVDVMFQSAAEVYGKGVLGIVMTGMGSDGKQGAAWIKAAGGTIWTESESSCIVYGMPRSVVEAGLSDRTIPLDFMAKALLKAL